MSSTVILDSRKSLYWFKYMLNGDAAATKEDLMSSSVALVKGDALIVSVIAL